MLKAKDYSNKLILKNSIALYIRMIFSVCVSLYTSRVILEILGVDDFGIYNVVGGVVILMSFINTSMSGATSRFLTFDLAKEDKKELRKTFSSSLQIHIAISFFIFIIGESLGLWFINTKLIIPQDRLFSANWVYQLSLINMMITVIQVPFSATLIAREKMNIYSSIEIFNILLKLCVVFMLLYVSYDKLISYAVFLLIVAFIITFIYIAYCCINFQECRLLCTFYKDKLCPLLKFSGWDLYGNGCVAAQNQGTNFIINNFFGVALNAGSGIATQATNILLTFTSNIVMAFRPQIIKEYSIGNYNRMQELLENAIIISLSMITLILIPLYLNIEFIMGLWLKNIPAYASIFCKIMLLINAVGLINGIIVIGIHATGEIKYLSFFSGTIYLLSLPTIYVFFKNNFPPQYSYIILLCFGIIIFIVNNIILKRQIRQISIIPIIIKSLPILLGIFSSYLILFWLSNIIDGGFVRLLVCVVVNTLIIGLFVLLQFRKSIKQILNLNRN